MSRNKNDIADADVNPSGREGPGFASVRPPELSANETARAMTGNPTAVVGPVAMPEEAQEQAEPVGHPMQRVTARRPIADIVDQFLADIQNHPDAHLLTTTLAGPADEAEAQAFPDAPVRSLRVDQIRLIRRTSTEIIPSGPHKRKAWQQQVIDDMKPAWEQQRQNAIESGRHGEVMVR